MNFQKIKSELISIATIILGVFAFKSTFIANYTVPTGSMRTTIEIGDKLLVNKMAYSLRIPFSKIRLMEFDKPKRGDVIVFDCPYDPSTEFVKRLIAIPGDLLEVENGFITLNGKPLAIPEQDQNRMHDILSNGGSYQETLDGVSYQVRRVPSPIHLPPLHVKIPEGYYFAMGDNRDESNDSRSWGFVPEDYIRGQAKFIYFSYEWPTTFRWNRIGNKF